MSDVFALSATVSSAPPHISGVAAKPHVAAKPSIAGLSRAALSERLAAIDVPEKQLRMRVTQLWHWIYVRGSTDFNDMTSISKTLRASLAEAYTLERPIIVSEQISQDGTRKWLIRLPAVDQFDKGSEVECVYIPETGRGTLCVSSQVGCTLKIGRASCRERV